jgi:hypothetical protein
VVKPEQPAPMMQALGDWVIWSLRSVSRSNSGVWGRLRQGQA